MLGSVLLYVGLSLTQDVSAEEQNRQEREKLQGEWVLDSGEFRGKSATPLLPEVYRIQGSEYTLEGSQGANSKSSFSLDATTSPKHFDRTMPGGTKLLGIYKLEGDMLTICSGTSVERPGEFTTITPGWRMLVWKRKAMKKE
jgi:uncharacterized protein (TIGR03067 family)